MSKDSINAVEQNLGPTSAPSKTSRRRVGVFAKWLLAGAMLTGISGVAMAHTDLNIGVNLGGPAMVAQPVYYGPPPPRYYGPPRWHHRHHWRDRWGRDHWGPRR